MRLFSFGKEKVVNKVKQNCITFRHKDFENITLYCVSRWVHVINEGSSDQDFLSKKAHPFGNEWHTISCALSGILVDLEIVEGKDRSKELGKDPANRFGATGGILSRLCRSGNAVKREFKYTTVFSNRFLYRHSIDDHNNLHHSVSSLEETWVTHCWPHRVLSLLLVVSEVNACLALKHFDWGKKGTPIPTLHHFCRKLALSLIYNPWLDTEDEKVKKSKRKRRCHHEICTVPLHAKKFSCGKWDTTAKEKYQRYTSC